MLKATVSSGAKIDAIHIRVSSRSHDHIESERVSEQKGVRGFPFEEGEEVDVKWNINDRHINEPVCLCVRGRFETGGQIQFIGGGLQFER